MINKIILCHKRVRKITGSFAFIEHRFLRDGFMVSLTHQEILLYFFLVLAADRYGLSFYSYDKICSLLRITVEDYLEARNQLLEKDLIAFNGQLFQVLSLPQSPLADVQNLLKTRAAPGRADPATVREIFAKAFGGKP
jgi:hypothetical protein